LPCKPKQALAPDLPLGAAELIASIPADLSIPDFLKRTTTFQDNPSNAEGAAPGRRAIGVNAQLSPFFKIASLRRSECL
jgi:hypothetical protein